MNTMSMQYNNREHFQPVISVVDSKNEIEQIFSIPYKNSVGTYYAEDGITALECNGGVSNKKLVFPLYKSFPLAPNQIFCMLPVNKDEIVYGFNVILNIVNFQKNSDIGYATGLQFTFKDVAIVDKKNYVFLLKLQEGENAFCYKLIKLQEPTYAKKSEWGKFDVLGELSSEKQLQNTLDNCQRDEFFFFYSEKNHLLQAFDKNLKLTNHPLIDAVNGYPNSIGTLLVHPKYPFSIFISWVKTNSGFFRQSFNIVRWEHPDKEKRILPYPFKELLNQSSQYDFFSEKIQFSPDGNWLIIHDDTDDNPVVVAFPVQKDNPMYLGKPVFLGKIIRKGENSISSAWIEDPMNYVICDGRILYSWELGKIKDKLEYKE